MKIKEVYQENKDKRYNKIKKIKNKNIGLQINPVKKITDNWIVLLGILVVIIGLLLIKFNWKVFCISLVLILFFTLLFIWGNKAKIECTNDYLYVKQGFQENKIKYSNLINVCIGRALEFMFFIPTYSYNIFIRYKDQFSMVREINLSLMCAEPEDVKKLIENFETENKIDQQIVRFEKLKSFGKFLALLGSFVLIVFVIIYFIKVLGV